MRFQCDRCGKRYSAAEPLREGRTYSIRCRACGHKIVVRAAPAGPQDPEPELPTVLPPRGGADAPNAPELEAAFETLVTPAQAFRLAPASSPPPIPPALPAAASGAPLDEELVEATSEPTPVPPPEAIGSWSDMHPLAPREPLRDPLPPSPPPPVPEHRPTEPGLARGRRVLWIAAGGVAAVTAIALAATFMRGPQPAREERDAPATPPRTADAASDDAPVRAAAAPPPAPAPSPEPAAAAVARAPAPAPVRTERAAPPAPPRKPAPPARVAAAPARPRRAAPELPVVVVTPEPPLPAAPPPEPKVASMAPRAVAPPEPAPAPPPAVAPPQAPTRAVEPPAEPRLAEVRATAPRPARSVASRPPAPAPAPAPASAAPDEGRGDVLRVVLRKDVDGLGRSGETVEVPAGYGRSFLLAKGLAVSAARKGPDAAQARDDEPVMPGAGYRRPAPTTPQCVEKNLHFPSGGDGRSVTIRFAVGRTGVADLVNVEPGPGWPASRRVEPGIVEAVNTAVRGCRFTPGADEQGRPARLWVVMQVPVGGS
jgi:DNA-directed RNA polymerase subunit RPC12/RpoP